MDLLRERARVRGHHRAQFGGDSSSSSSQETTYNFTDNRSVSSVDNHSTNILSGNSGSGNISVDRAFNTNSFNTTTTNTSVTQTDHGAVQGALQSNATNTALLFQLADKLFTGNREIVTQNQTLAKELSSNANSAYEGATAQANGNKTMLLIGVAVVGIVAVMAWRYK